MSRYHQLLTNCPVKGFRHLMGSKLKDKVNRERRKTIFRPQIPPRLRKGRVGRHPKAVRAADVRENQEYMEMPEHSTLTGMGLKHRSSTWAHPGACTEVAITSQNFPRSRDQGHFRSFYPGNHPANTDTTKTYLTELNISEFNII